ncbi:hypothetical protein C4D60_Mb01t08300 [Musa balbisiana]|uniref:Uncharacterized protein n=1 Tax=Musa balbisiana TaxID=52838 RepID=A0A4S8JKR5_MUSBA|nr:hypothetical protein C4D60_Mb01t08300 [Musa balbisiana]
MRTILFLMLRILRFLILLGYGKSNPSQGMSSWRQVTTRGMNIVKGVADLIRRSSSSQTSEGGTSEWKDKNDFNASVFSSPAALGQGEARPERLTNLPGGALQTGAAWALARAQALGASGERLGKPRRPNQDFRSGSVLVRLLVGSIEPTKPI